MEKSLRPISDLSGKLGKDDYNRGGYSTVECHELKSGIDDNRRTKAT